MYYRRQHLKVLTDGLELGVGVDDTGLVEERDERLVSALDDHQLERVAVECDALERLQDGAHRGAAGDCQRARPRSESHGDRDGMMDNELFPIPPIALSEWMASSRMLAYPRACSMNVGGRRCA